VLSRLTKPMCGFPRPRTTRAEAVAFVCVAVIHVMSDASHPKPNFWTTAQSRKGVVNLFQPLGGWQGLGTLGAAAAAFAAHFSIKALAAVISRGGLNFHDLSK
jgi:hypothetical protein